MSLSDKFKVFSEYPRHNTINSYLKSLSVKFPELVTLMDVGKTFEGRFLKAIKISSSTNIENRSCIFIDGGTHAREWISVSTALYCIYMLVERNASNKHLLENLDWIVMPVVNADGYEYSHEKDRFWRKTRRPNEGVNDIGTDCNRNYDFHWEKGCKNPCKLTYRGEKPFSEPETIAVKSIMESLNFKCKFYLSLHSHGQSILYPWAYTKELPNRWRDLHNLAEIGYLAIRRTTGSIFRYTNISSFVKRPTGGGSTDYAFGTAKIPFVLCLECGGRKFHPPKKNIKLLIKEVWIGIKAMSEYVSNKYGKKQ